MNLKQIVHNAKIVLFVLMGKKNKPKKSKYIARSNEEIVASINQSMYGDIRTKPMRQEERALARQLKA